MDYVKTQQKSQGWHKYNNNHMIFNGQLENRLKTKALKNRLGLKS